MTSAPRKCLRRSGSDKGATADRARFSGQDEGQKGAEA